MAAALPFVDNFLPIGSVASLEELGKLLSAGAFPAEEPGNLGKHATRAT
jgi:hypothetical protein